MIPLVDEHGIGDVFHVGKVHHHTLFRRALGADDVAGQGDFERVAVAVQVAALAGVMGNAVTGIEFQSACD